MFNLDFEKMLTDVGKLAKGFLLTAAGLTAMMAIYHGF